MISKEMLENKVEKGLVVRSELSQNMRLGDAKVFVYEDQTKHEDIRTCQHGWNVLEENAHIRLHNHQGNMSEMLTVEEGIIEVNGKAYFKGQTVHCSAGEMHNCINRYKGKSIVRFIKRE